MQKNSYFSSASPVMKNQSVVGLTFMCAAMGYYVIVLVFLFMRTTKMFASTVDMIASTTTSSVNLKTIPYAVINMF